jgi:hypothetical protein
VVLRDPASALEGDQHDAKVRREYQRSRCMAFVPVGFLLRQLALDRPEIKRDSVL